MGYPFDSVTILPGYAGGFTFMWDLAGDFTEPLPWVFKVQEGPGPEGPWKDISPELETVTAWRDDNKRILGKDPVLYFRVVLSTPEHNYTSHIKTPYGDLPRREYLIVKEIMRKEALQQRTMSGVYSKLWSIAVWGPKCTSCVDPISGRQLKTNCPDCYGTGRRPGYHGPYGIWTTFSPLRRNPEQKPDGTGVNQVYSRSVRIIGFPYIKDYDIICVKDTDKRYIVDGVANITEIRGVPVIQSVMVKELPMSDPAYRLGESTAEEPCALPAGGDNG